MSEPRKEKWFRNKLDDAIDYIGFANLKIFPRTLDFLFALAKFADKTGLCWPTQEQIENFCGIHHTNHHRHIKILKKLGFITVKRKYDRRQKMTRNYYTIHLDAILTISMGVNGDLQVDGIAVRPSATASKPTCLNIEPNVMVTDEPNVMVTDATIRTTHTTKLPMRASLDIVQESHLDAIAVSNVLDLPKDYYFNEFWQAYPRKEGKKDAHRAWVKHQLDKKSEQIIDDVRKRQTRHLPWLDGRSFIPLPATYLNGERWTDEIIGAENHDKTYRRTASQESTINAQREYLERLKKEG